MNKEKLIIFDTILRDGEKSPGASMTGDEKIRIAATLESTKVDINTLNKVVNSDGSTHPQLGNL